MLECVAASPASKATQLLLKAMAAMDAAVDELRGAGPGYAALQGYDRGALLKWGGLVLAEAASEGDLGVVRALGAAGCDADVVRARNDGRGEETPLTRACEEGAAGTVGALPPRATTNLKPSLSLTTTSPTPASGPGAAGCRGRPHGRGQV
jgi:hypothetical protein